MAKAKRIQSPIKLNKPLETPNLAINNAST
jgi:hypothetical protein